ncbi:hypothetical protein N7523_000110 [Penicillium sp. IBT 18751x]|nr:hypothetical protein N7523_000110 [Penicillium sp. IBT 18751x]
MSTVLQRGSVQQLHFMQHELQSGVRVLDDGRLDIQVNPRKSSITEIPEPETPYTEEEVFADSLTPTVSAENPFPVRLNIVIQVVGSRGDIQPFVALGKELSQAHNHRVRLATHGKFRSFVQNAGLEFFDIGGDPEQLMAFMVKNPGLFPDLKTIRSGAIRNRRRDMREIIDGCWRSCFESGNELPFVADAIIANPPSQAHIHCAQRLGIPLHLMFTQDAVVADSETAANLYSYTVVDALVWEGLGDIINKFRRKTLVLDPLDRVTGPNLLNQLHVPYAYLWSPALLKKPSDWAENIDICGFCFLPSDSSYVPPIELTYFLNAGPPPIYVGFGSIVVNDPSALTKTVFEAVKRTGQRALVSKGWANLGGDITIPDNIMLIDSLPHDWLFAHVSCIVHHGGAGTTAAGLSLGCPTVIVSFFGDQQFWGRLVAHVGAGPQAIQYKNITVENLANAINIALEPETKEKAQAIQHQMAKESGTWKAVHSFHRQLNPDRLGCAICPSRASSWYVRTEHVGISAFAAAVLITEGLLKTKHIDLYRAAEYDTYRDPCGPLTAGAHIFFGAINDFSASLAALPEVISSKFIAARAAINRQHSHVDPKAECGHLHPSSERLRREDSSASAKLSRSPGVHSGGDTKHTHQPTGQTEASRSRFRELILESRIHGSRGLKRLYNIVIWMPTDISLTFTKALHNFPNRYNDPMIRPTPEITGIRSGLRAARVEFIEQFHDGITGLVAQPRYGLKHGGVKGMLKGVGKGLGGAVIKPLAEEERKEVIQRWHDMKKP